MPSRPIRRDPYPRPPPPDQQALSPEQVGEDDRLEAPGINTRLVVWLGAGLMVFIAVSLIVLTSFFRLETGDVAQPPPRTFPAPRLEASIDPRVVPATQPGPVQAIPPRIPVPAAEPLDRAMQVIAAQGANAYAPRPVAGDQR